ncbi:MAG: sigma-70 family RNA polymerase sigma factor [Planctomycetes bacterium]|nr:sigma-70 family RNA polymerase sigma factor [Planctomycetota bacterium]
MTETHDPATFDLQLFTQHAAGLRALVRTLVVDDNRIDDVVQETWLAALKSPPRDQKTAFAWLAKVARRMVHRVHREETRRRGRELKRATPEQLPPTDEIVSRELARRQVVDVVLELKEPYKTAILYRFFENLGPSEIAARLGVPTETVRTRVKRGLEQMRQRLDRRSGGIPTTWHLALLPLARLPMPVLPVLPVGQAALEALRSSGAQLFALFHAWPVAIMVLLLSVAAGWGLSEVTFDSQEEPVREVALRSIPTPPTAASTAEHETRTESDAEASPTALARLRFVDRHSESPLTGLQVALRERPTVFDQLDVARVPDAFRRMLREEYEGSEPGAATLERTDASGTVTTPRGNLPRFVALADPYYYLSDSLRTRAFESPQTFECELGGRVEGFVALPLGAPEPTAANPIRVHLFGRARHTSGPWNEGLRDLIRRRHVAIASPPANFAFDGLAAHGLEYRVVVVYPGVGLAESEPLQVVPGETTRIEVGITSGTGARFVVRTSAGNPIAGAELTVLQHVPRRGEPRDGWPGRLPPLDHRLTDADGRADLQGLAAGTYQVVARAEGYRPRMVRIDMPGPNVDAIEITLGTSRALVGHVENASGEPVADADVRVFGARGRRNELGSRTVTGPDGSFRLDDVPGGMVRLVATDAAGAEGTVEREDSATDDCVIVLQPRPVLRVVLDLPEGGPEPGRVRISLGGGRGSALGGPGEARFPVFEATLGQGPFLIPGVDGGAYALHVVTDSYADATVRVDVPAGEGAGITEVHVALVRPGSVRGRALMGGFGLPVEGAEVQLVPVRDGRRIASRSLRGFTDQAGAFAFGFVVPGTYALQASHPASACQDVTLVTLEPGERLANLTLTFQEGLPLTGRILEGTEGLADTVVVLEPAGDSEFKRHFVEPTRSDGAFTFPNLGPGSYVLSVYQPGRPRPEGEDDSPEAEPRRERPAGRRGDRRKPTALVEKTIEILPGRENRVEIQLAQ